jgi:hypothetical protein
VGAGALPRRGADSPLVRPGLHADRRVAVPRADPCRTTNRYLSQQDSGKTNGAPQPRWRMDRVLLPTAHSWRYLPPAIWRQRADQHGPCLAAMGAGGSEFCMPTTASVPTVLRWHVHGSWTEVFVQGRHRYLLPRNTARDANGRGLCGRQWPRAEEIAVEKLADKPVDLVVLQRPEELELAARWLRRRPGARIDRPWFRHSHRPRRAHRRRTHRDRSGIAWLAGRTGEQRRPTAPGSSV